MKQNEQKKEEQNQKYEPKHQVKQKNDSDLKSKIAMFSRPNHGLPTAHDLNAKSAEPKTSQQTEMKKMQQVE